VLGRMKVKTEQNIGGVLLYEEVSCYGCGFSGCC